jgi:hypothetical protein
MYPTIVLSYPTRLYNTLTAPAYTSQVSPSTPRPKYRQNVTPPSCLNPRCDSRALGTGHCPRTCCCKIRRRRRHRGSTPLDLGITQHHRVANTLLVPEAEPIRGNDPVLTCSGQGGAISGLAIVHGETGAAQGGYAAAVLCRAVV